MPTELSAPGAQDSSKPSRRELAQRIQLFTDEGLSAGEIGRRLGCSRQRVLRIAQQFNVRLQPRGGSRRVGAQFNRADYELMLQLAQAAGCSVGAMLVRLARVPMAGGVVTAKRKLGRDALPKRGYRRAAA